jgi:hypothetical protein
MVSGSRDVEVDGRLSSSSSSSTSASALGCNEGEPARRRSSTRRASESCLSVVDHFGHNGMSTSERTRHIPSLPSSAPLQVQPRPL